MPNYEECRRKADEAVTWAAATNDDEERRIYLEIATCWLKLAKKAPDRPDQGGQHNRRGRKTLARREWPC